MNESWIKETMGLIEDLQIKKSFMESKLEGLRDEIEELDKKIAGGEALIQAYRSKHNVLPLPIEGIRPGYFGTKSYSEILIDIATISGGYIKVLDVAEILLKAGVSKDKRVIQSNVYAALRRMADHFIKVKAGEYRYTNGLPKRKTVRERTSSGVQAAIKELKDRDPQATKKAVLDFLLKTGFDFKGKKPANAVNIVWAKLGYSKEGTQ